MKYDIVEIITNKLFNLYHLYIQIWNSIYLIQMLLIQISETLIWLPNDRTYNPIDRYICWIRIRVECKTTKINSINAASVFRFSNVKETDKTDLLRLTDKSPHIRWNSVKQPNPSAQTQHLLSLSHLHLSQLLLLSFAPNMHHAFLHLIQQNHPTYWPFSTKLTKISKTILIFFLQHETHCITFKLMSRHKFGVSVPKSCRNLYIY